MSHLPSEALSYERVVAEYFLALKGAGLMLSPLDQEQVRAWERRGLPVAVVCRGLRRGLGAAAGRAGGPPRSLRALRRAVEEEWRAYRSGRVGDAPAPPEEPARALRRVGAALELLEGAARGPHAEAYLAARRLLAARPPPRDLDEVEAAFLAVDEALLRAWLAALGAAERAALGPRCRLRAGPRTGATRRAAYRRALRSHLFDAAREAGLLCLRGSV